MQLIKSLGVTHYRFSIDWSRVMKNGKTRNPVGMEYYKDLCRELKKEGIQCIVRYFIFCSIRSKLYIAGDSLPC